MKLLGRLLGRRTAPLDDSFISMGRTVERARLLGISRCGLLSWRARIDGQLMKVYETHDPGQSRFIERVSRLPEIADYFPRVFETSGNLVFAAWIEGKPLAKNAFKTDPEEICRVARFQAKLHAITLPDSSPPADPAFSYRTYLIDRLERFDAPWPNPEARERLLALVDGFPERQRPWISHPDLTPQNLVSTTDGFKIIDNELLAPSGYPLIDLFNTHRVFGRNPPQGSSDLYLRAYSDAGGNFAHVVSEPNFYEALWAIRCIGSRLQDGRFDLARSLSEAALAQGSVKHELIRAAEGILEP